MKKIPSKYRLPKHHFIFKKNFKKVHLCSLKSLTSIELARELTRDRISTSKTEFELPSVEISLSRYPKRLGSSIGDQMVENGDLWRTSPRVG